MNAKFCVEVRDVARLTAVREKAGRAGQPDNSDVIMLETDACSSPRHTGGAPAADAVSSAGRNAYGALLRDVEAAGVEYAILRDHPDQAGMRDLDLLTAAGKRGEFLRCCSRHGFQLIKSGRNNPGKMVLLRWQESGPQILDVHERLIYQGYEYMQAATVLSRRRREGRYWFLSFEDEWLTLLWHNILGKGQIQPKHRRRLEELLLLRLDEAYLDSQLQAFGLRATGREARRNFTKLADNPKAVQHLRRRVLRTLWFHPWQNAVRRLHLALAGIHEKWFGPRRGALIVFLGPDGCGKSSLTKALRAELRSASLTADIVYLGPWGQSRLPLHKILSLLNFKPYRPEDKAKYHNRAVKPATPGPLTRAWRDLKGRIFYLALALELWYRYLAEVLPRLRRGRIVLADRYIYDVLIGYKNRPMNYFRGLREWLCRTYPRADLVILLDAPPEVIHARKPQFEVAQLQDIRQRYTAVGQRYGFHVLDTSVSLETTLQAFRQQILPALLHTLKP
ncbi:MAG: hypothetical protein ONB48_00870 [candidate division KSB1 bacterium]|nr:hypothetical protein [candidate division KSB1 bacterium]MDZ7272771.1 hypothetical protein [candidate division KSB1 bacterium]MDZ7284205.1 hypothetical protein [candidate division KSB1 bacterium]MDZ7297397.1 hypothetical protein [candidate division KSB1 bacterium]MDZ7306543.1 hypothetical protein [candidate division KSB1 bacterium]